MKKLVSIILSLVMLASISVGFGLTASAETSGDFEYIVLDDGTAEIIDYLGSATVVNIPSTIDGYTISSIGESAFDSCDTITDVTIPNGVTQIKDNAFWSCDSLVNLSIPDSVTSIGLCAIAWCYDLPSITLPSNLEIIADSAFIGCISLKEITIPASVTYIGEAAFTECHSMTNINVDENNTVYSEQDGVLFNKDKTELVQYPVGKTSPAYSIPNGVTTICANAFYTCKTLEKITIPTSVTAIGRGAFNACSNLTTVNYLGTSAQWEKVTVEDWNGTLTSAAIHFADSQGTEATTNNSAQQESGKTESGEKAKTTQQTTTRKEDTSTKSPDTGASYTGVAATAIAAVLSGAAVLFLKKKR